MIPEVLSQYIGQTVTIFTVSGGPSGFGFTGALLSVNPSYITLISRLGAPPAKTAVTSTDRKSRKDRKSTDAVIFIVNSLCDIPLDKIAAFRHRAM